MGQKQNATPWYEALEVGIDVQLEGLSNDTGDFLYDTVFGPACRFEKPDRQRKWRPGKNIIGAEYKIQRIKDDAFMDADDGDRYDRGANATMVFGKNPEFDPLTGNVTEMSHAIREGVIDVSSVQGCDAAAANLAAAIHRHKLNVEKRMGLFLRTSTWHDNVTPGIKWDQPGARAIEDMGRTADLVGATRAIMSHEAYNLLKYHEDANSERQGSSVLSHKQLTDMLNDKCGVKEIIVSNVREKRPDGEYKWLFDRISPDGKPWIFLQAGSGQIQYQSGDGTFRVGHCAAKYVLEDIPMLRGMIASMRYGDMLLEQGVEMLSRSEVTTLGHAFKFQQVNKHAGVLLTGLI